MVDTLTGVINQLKGVPDLTCIMLVKIAMLLVTIIQVFSDIKQTGHPWTRFFEGTQGLSWNLLKAPNRQVLMGIYSRVIFLPAHFMVTFEEAFYTGFFEVQSNIFSMINNDLRSRYVAFMRIEKEMRLKDVLVDDELEWYIRRFRQGLSWT